MALLARVATVVTGIACLCHAIPPSVAVLSSHHPVPVMVSVVTLYRRATSHRMDPFCFDELGLVRDVTSSLHRRIGSEL